MISDKWLVLAHLWFWNLQTTKGWLLWCNISMIVNRSLASCYPLQLMFPLHKVWGQGKFFRCHTLSALRHASVGRPSNQRCVAHGGANMLSDGRLWVSSNRLLLHKVDWWIEQVITWALNFQSPLRSCICNPSLSNLSVRAFSGKKSPKPFLTTFWTKPIVHTFNYLHQYSQQCWIFRTKSRADFFLLCCAFVVRAVVAFVSIVTEPTPQLQSFNQKIMHLQEPEEKPHQLSMRMQPRITWFCSQWNRDA